MARYNKTGANAPTPRRTSALKTVSGSKATTHTGGKAYVSDEKSELFRLGVNLFAGGENTFHEGGAQRDSRFVQLVSSQAVSDPQWTFEFLYWLRDEGNIRTASVLGSVAAIHARLASGSEAKLSKSQPVGFNRAFAGEVPQRLDEVGELFAIWDSLYGKPFPQALKRGAGDALKRLGNEYSLMKYDTPSHAWRVADILGVAHVNPDDEVQAQLFAMAIANRYGNEYSTSLLPMVEENIRLRREAAKNPKVLLDSARLKAAGMTWEDALSLAGNSVKKSELWNALILGGSVGYMAMLRNLRNFQEAGISKEAEQYVLDKLADPYAVSKSRQFPFRFWSAYKNAQGTQWVHPLETALSLATQNIPELPGKTLVLIDTSGSMEAPVSNKSTLRRDEAAAIFGASVAARNPGRVDLHMFADRTAEVRTTKGGSVLRTVEEVMRRNSEVGWGTQTTEAVRATYKNHDRVMIFTDGQSFRSHWGDPSQQVPESTYVYAWDLSGYQNMDIPSGEGTRHQLSGLTDGTFKAIPLLERGKNSPWPWQVAGQGS